MKVARTVLNEESGGNVADLHNNKELSNVSTTALGQAALYFSILQNERW